MAKPMLIPAKGKIIPSYEISVVVLWEGEAKDSDGWKAHWEEIEGGYGLVGKGPDPGPLGPLQFYQFLHLPRWPIYIWKRKVQWDLFHVNAASR